MLRVSNISKGFDGDITDSAYRDRFIEGTIDGEMGSAHHRFPLSPLLSIKLPLCNSRKHFSPSLCASVLCALRGNLLDLKERPDPTADTPEKACSSHNEDQSKFKIGRNGIGFNDYHQSRSGYNFYYHSLYFWHIRLSA